MIARNQNRFTRGKKIPNGAFFFPIRFTRREALWLLLLASADLADRSCGMGGEG